MSEEREASFKARAGAEHGGCWLAAVCATKLRGVSLKLGATVRWFSGPNACCLRDRAD